MIIDFHTHVFSPKIIENRDKYALTEPVFQELYANPKAKLVSTDELIRNMDEQEIDISVILNINWQNPDTCKETNDYILESISRYSSRLIGFGMINFNLKEEAIREINRCSKNGIRGIGEIRFSQEMLSNPKIAEPIIHEIIDRKLILLTHSSEPVGHLYPGKGKITPELLYSLIGTYPELKLVCAHWGGGLPFYGLMPEVKKSLRNVYFDSAASPYIYDPEIYIEAANLVGKEKILFGTDYPLLSPKRLLNQIKALNMSSDTQNLILAENARKLLELS
jgi:predicted TIM-barrel fold metal-dependent hydrolase